MARFKVYKVPTVFFEASNFNTKHQDVINIEDHSNGNTKTCTIEEFFELAVTVKEFADALKAEEKAKLQQHIDALEERLAASKKLLAELDQL